MLKKLLSLLIIKFNMLTNETIKLYVPIFNNRQV